MNVIKFYFHPTPNPMKIALFLTEADLPFEVIPVDTMKGEQHEDAFTSINPNAKLPAIDDDGAVVFDSNAILLYLSDKYGLFGGKPEDRPALLSWLMFIATGVGPYSGQAVHFQHMAPEGNDYAVNRYRREMERHYGILEQKLAGQTWLMGDDYTIIDISAWGWIDRSMMVLGEGAIDAYPNLKAWLERVNARPAMAKAREVGKDIPFKSERDEVAMRALFPQNYQD